MICCMKTPQTKKIILVCRVLFSLKYQGISSTLLTTFVVQEQKLPFLMIVVYRETFPIVEERRRYVDHAAFNSKQETDIGFTCRIFGIAFIFCLFF